jgi:hypothetical protein
MANLSWSPASPFTILIDQGQDAWHAGHVDDILVLDTGAIVVGTWGGVWLVDGNDNTTPLSDGWDNPGVGCLAFGPDGSRHILAGGTALFETDTSAFFPLLNWRPVPLKPVSPQGSGIGTINRIVVLKQRRRIVLACSNGVFWSPIPAQGNAYNWQEVTSLPPGGYSGLAVGPNDRVAIEAWGSDPSKSLYGIFYADWLDGEMLPLRSPITGVDPAKMFRTSLASCDNQPDIMYAVSSRTSAAPDREWIYAVLKSEDGGATWSKLQTNVLGMNVPLESQNPDVAGGEGSYNNCIAVCPFFSGLVAIGWRSGPHISTDGGANWHRHTEQDTLHLHSDLHAVRFDPNDQAGQHLWVGSDGGLALTPDQGQTFVSHMNKHLNNLQFYGGKFSASYHTPGLVAGATQDNGNLFCTIGLNTTPWTWMEGGDGGLMLLVGADELLHYHNTQVMLRVAQWDGTKFNDAGQVSSNGLLDIPSKPVCAIVNTPVKRNATGQLMWAVAAGGSTGTSVYGIFANNQGPGMHYELLGQVPVGLGLGAITALGSADGTRVFVGKAGGLIYVINTDQQTVQQLTVVPLKDSSEGDDGASIDGIIVQSDNLAFAILSNSQYAGGQNFILRWNGASWIVVGAGKGLPGDQFVALDADSRTNARRLFAATDKQMFGSYDNGDTWQVQSSGLPAESRCTDLRFAIEPTGARYLYLATYGRSTWRARIIPLWHQQFGLAVPGSVRPGSPLVVINRTPQQQDAFWIGANGDVSSNWQNDTVDGGGWHQQIGIAVPGSVRADSLLIVIARVPEHLDVFWVGVNGDVSYNWWDANIDNGNWHQQIGIAVPGSVRPGSPLVVMARTPDHLDVFWIGADGDVSSNWFGWDANV